jgi:ATP-dependent helicase/nuclease subunit B
MVRIDPTRSSRLLAALARASQRTPVGRKLVVAPTAGGARELLRRLALESGGWIGFEVTTPRPLALRLARDGMVRRAMSPLDAFEQRALLDEALDAALLGTGEPWEDLSEGVGFREGVHDAIEALRLAGIPARTVERSRMNDPDKRAFLSDVLRRYERLLLERGRADTAAILGLAVEELEAGEGDVAARLGADTVLLQPGLGARGLTGRLVASLTARGAKVLETDPVVGREVPDTVLWSRGTPTSGHAFLHAPGAIPAGVERPRIELFHAASIHDELREVLRRAVDRGLRWDEIEIVTPDPAAYGSALHVLSTQLGVPVTYAVGLPVERTRVGRVIQGYLDWISEGFQAAPFRRLLEAGDIRPPRSHGSLPAAALARRFRTLRIGWGRRRYRERILSALGAVERLEPRTGEPHEMFVLRRARWKAELAGLRAIVFPVLRETPHVPDRATDTGMPVSPAEIARGLLAFLRRVPRGRGPERAAREEIQRILERVEATLRRRTHFRGAVAILRRHMDIRVRAAAAGADQDHPGAPWASDGGHVHLSDLEHGGYTGRPAVFFVGMDAERLPGTGGQDALLLDSDRRILGRALPTSYEVLHERGFRTSALFARLRGDVTLSYSAWNPAEARTPSPSPFLLQALRLTRNDEGLTFEDLRADLGRVVCAVPGEGRFPLDRDDAWMAALGGEAVLRGGSAAIRRSYPALAEGLRARDHRVMEDPGPFHGVVSARPEELDPRRNERRVLSSSALEGLGACPLSYLYRSVLGLRAPDDPELDPDRWLDERQRGALLHSVFETALRSARAHGVEPKDGAFEALAMSALEDETGRLRDELPVPGEGALARELAGLRDDVRSFVRMVREKGAPWLRMEFAFGLEDDPPVRVEVPGGSLHLRGVVDRIDDAGMQGLLVVDYKTGMARNFAGSGVFHGGRRLQHALYARAVEQRIGASVVAAEYHFPTLRGEHAVHRFDRSDLDGVERVIGHMLDGVAAGRFVPTDDPEDCRFCDYAEICRVDRLRFGGVDAPLARWAKERMREGASPAFESLAAVRSSESPGPSE